MIALATFFHSRIRNLHQSELPKLVKLITLINALWLAYSGWGDKPVVLADEYTYSQYSRFKELKQDYLPNYLYFIVFRISKIFGPDYYQASKLLNVFFYLVAMIFVYKIARLFLTQKVSVLIFLVTSVSSLSSFVAFFMPESMFFLLFYIVIYLAVKNFHESKSSTWVTFGVMIGLTSLVKPHALVLLIPFLFLSLSQKLTLIQKLKHYCFLLISCFGLKFLVSYLVAGKSGITLGGSLYDSFLITSITANFVLKCLSLLISNFLLVLFSTPIFLSITWLVFSKLATNNKKRKIKVNSISFSKGEIFLLLVSAIFVSLSSYFSAQISGSLGWKEVGLEYRYYIFTLPLVFIASISNLTKQKLQDVKVQTLVNYFVLCVINFCFITESFKMLRPINPLGPDWFLMTNPESFVNFRISLTLLSILLFLFDKKVFDVFLYYIVLPLVVSVSMYFVIAHHNLSQVEDSYSRAARIVERVVPDADNAKMISISPSLSGSYRFAFLLDWKSPGILTTADAEKYQGFDLVDYLVVFENLLKPENFSVIYTTNEFQILKRE